MEPLRLALPGGDALIAHLYRAVPERRRARSVVVAPATAAPQTYYAPFCRYLAEQGFDVIGFDFRGVAQSRLRPIRDYADVGFSDWAMQDYPAVIAHLHGLFPDQPLYIVGHSVGGWMPGVTPASADIDGILGVAALSAYWPLMARPHRYGHWLAWHVLVPASTALFGRWPGWAGLKHDLPAKLGREFSVWAKDPEFVFGARQFDARGNARAFRGHMHLLQIADDPWGTPAAVRALLEHYPNARSRMMETLRPADFGTGAIGHLGFFHSRHRETLWPHALACLDAFG